MRNALRGVVAILALIGIGIAFTSTPVHAFYGSIVASRVFAIGVGFGIAWFAAGLVPEKW